MTGDGREIRDELLRKVREDDLLLERLAASTLDGLWYWDLERPDRMWVSPRLKALFGYGPDEAAPVTALWRDNVHPDDRARAEAALARLGADPSAFFDEILRYRRRDGSIAWVRCRGFVIRDEAGRPVRMLGAHSDVTALKATEERLKRAVEAKTSILEATADGVMLLSVMRTGPGAVDDFVVEEGNPAAARMIGRTGDSLVGARMGRDFPEAFAAVLAPVCLAAIDGGRPEGAELCLDMDGARRWLRACAYPTGGDRIVLTLGDVSELKRVNLRLAEREALLEDVLEAVPDAVAAFDRDDRLAIFNDAYPRYYARSREAIALGNTFETILRTGVANGQYPEAGTGEAEREAWIRARLEMHRNPGHSHVLLMPDGRWLQVRERRSKSGYTVGVRSDVTKLKAIEAQLKRHAERDVLTELPNRKVFFEHLDRLVRITPSDAGGGDGGALAVLDMDHFKDINDTLGHDVGDAVLQEVARRLIGCSHSLSMVARLGGDEFAATIRPGRSEAELEAVVDHLLDVLSRPIVVQDKSIAPRFSIGVALIPRDGPDAASLFKNADIALYEAKRRGRARWSFFDPLIRDHLDRRASVIGSLRAAVAADRLSIVLQPQVRLADGHHAGFEALVRWDTAEGSMSPREFVPIAEESGLIAQVGGAVLSKALAFARHMIDDGLDPGRISVNVSAGQLKTDEFATLVEELLARNRLDPRRLELEMTELVLLDRAAGLIERSLRRLHALGVSIALDDFGTGHASLTNLKRFPVDRIKIDHSFVRDIGSDPDDAVIVRAIVNLAHSLGKEVVAEGVETEEQATFLRLNRCDVAQGFLYARPMGLRESADWLARDVVPAVRTVGAGLG